MNRKSKEQATKLAFGELSDKERALFRSLVTDDPELSQEVESYRTIKKGLKSLADVPEHQMSNERLREAILRQGLKPKPEQAFDWSWLWISALTCAAVAGVVLTLHPLRKAEPQLLLSSTEPAPTAPAKIFDSFGDSGVQHVAIRSSAGTAQARLQDESVHEDLEHRGLGRSVVELPRFISDFQGLTPAAITHRHHRVRRNGFSKMLLAQNPVTDETQTLDGADLTGTSETSPSATNAASNVAAQDRNVDFRVVDSKPSAGIIAITPARDEATGAPSAKEVASGTNLDVGG